MMQMKNLDFIVIGAQKSATTSLYRYLQQHPKIFMPADKEAPFFSHDRLYQSGWEAFAGTQFGSAPTDKLWGTVSPQYMYDMRAPSRIAKHMPHAKLIALLRNPVERAHSHYRMAVRRGTEKRSFPTVVDDLRRPGLGQGNRNASVLELHPDPGTVISEDMYYLAWSEYGRALKMYRQYFDEDQILVLYMDELKSNPRETVQMILEFIGAEGGVIPANVGKVYHRGGTQRIIPESWRCFVRDLPGFRPLWHCVPDRTRSTINYWYEQFNVKKQAPETIDSATRLKLVEYFRSDVKLLQNIFTRPVPWTEFSEIESSGAMT
ncbi:sulfotransferase domain-containing protein [Gammaproteobacteria bacterium]|nr:sulfotransferase domain-containing protein [Gammaproteobacteria bacterium]